MKLLTHLLGQLCFCFVVVLHQQLTRLASLQWWYLMSRE